MISSAEEKVLQAFPNALAKPTRVFGTLYYRVYSDGQSADPIILSTENTQSEAWAAAAEKLK